MKQKRNLLILLGVLVVICLAYVGITSQKAAEEAAEAEALALEEAESIIYLTELAVDDMAAISWNYNSELTFELVDDVWVYAADTSIPINQTTLGTSVSAFSYLTAVRELVDGDSLEYYGLEEPLYTVTITDLEGSDVVFYIGNAAEDGNYYLTMGDKTSIYTVASTVYTAIAYELTDLVTADTFTAATTDELTSVVVTSGGEELASYAWEDTEAFETIATGLSSLSLTTCVDANASDHLEDYALDEETRVTWTMGYSVEVEVLSSDEETYTTEEMSMEETLYIGYNDTELAIYYVQVDGSNLVYSVDQDTIDMLLNQYVEVVE